MTDPTKPMECEVWAQPPRPDGAAFWGWRVLREDQVIALGECTNASFARRAAEAAAKSHGRPVSEGA